MMLGSRASAFAVLSGIPLLARASAAASVWCPAASDFTLRLPETSSVELQDQGWIFTGPPIKHMERKNVGFVRSKAAFNLLGGSVDFDMDVTGFSNGPCGGEAAIKTVSPQNGSASDCSFNHEYSPEPCPEVNWISTSGHCTGQAAIKLPTGTGGACDAGNFWAGCQMEHFYRNRTAFHVRIEYQEDGTTSIFHDGELVALTPSPTAVDWSAIKTAYQERGAVVDAYMIDNNCFEDEVYANASCWTQEDYPPQVYHCEMMNRTNAMSVSNMRIKGTVVHGPEPRLCSSTPDGASSDFSV